ncbi:hypothetical protein [Klebsiella pneumoniae]|uniref:DinB/UmuC family translesion DNA polymerase n=1 Tax=Klebsiella pneumoniae TaxID=573 RepID=UPI0035EAB643
MVATQDSRDIIAAAQRALARIWRDGYRYANAGIMLADLFGLEAQMRSPTGLRSPDECRRSD